MRDKDLVVAEYIPEATKSGYLARIHIELHRDGRERHELDCIYLREFADMNEALAKTLQLVALAGQILA
jgi:hypothetical protein